MTELSNLNYLEECKNWLSKKELMDICKCDVRTLERIVTELKYVYRNAIQSHIKKGGYNNLETYYDDYLVKLIQEKLKKNGLSQKNQMEKTWQSKAQNIKKFLVWKPFVSMFL